MTCYTAGSGCRFHCCYSCRLLRWSVVGGSSGSGPTAVESAAAAVLGTTTSSAAAAATVLRLAVPPAARVFPAEASAGRARATAAALLEITTPSPPATVERSSARRLSTARTTSGWRLLSPFPPSLAGRYYRSSRERDYTSFPFVADSRAAPAAVSLFQVAISATVDKTLSASPSSPAVGAAFVSYWSVARCGVPYAAARRAAAISRYETVTPPAYRRYCREFCIELSAATAFTAAATNAGTASGGATSFIRAASLRAKAARRAALCACSLSVASISVCTTFLRAVALADIANVAAVFPIAALTAGPAPAAAPVPSAAATGGDTSTSRGAAFSASKVPRSAAKYSHSGGVNNCVLRLAEQSRRLRILTIDAHHLVTKEQRTSRVSAVVTDDADVPACEGSAAAAATVSAIASASAAASPVLFSDAAAAATGASGPDAAVSLPSYTCPPEPSLRRHYVWEATSNEIRKEETCITSKPRTLLGTIASSAVGAVKAVGSCKDTDDAAAAATSEHPVASPRHSGAARWQREYRQRPCSLQKQQVYQQRHAQQTLNQQLCAASQHIQQEPPAQQDQPCAYASLYMRCFHLSLRKCVQACIRSVKCLTWREFTTAERGCCRMRTAAVAGLSASRPAAAAGLRAWRPAAPVVILGAVEYCTPAVQVTGLFEASSKSALPRRQQLFIPPVQQADRSLLQSEGLPRPQQHQRHNVLQKQQCELVQMLLQRFSVIVRQQQLILKERSSTEEHQSQQVNASPRHLEDALKGQQQHRQQRDHEQQSLLQRLQQELSRQREKKETETHRVLKGRYQQQARGRQPQLQESQKVTPPQQQGAPHDLTGQPTIQQQPWLTQQPLPLRCRRDRGGKVKTKLRREERRRRRAQLEKLRAEKQRQQVRKQPLSSGSSTAAKAEATSRESRMH